MLYEYGHEKYFYFTSESDVNRRQILTSKVDPRAVRVNALDTLCAGEINEWVQQQQKNVTTTPPPPGKKPQFF